MVGFFKEENTYSVVPKNWILEENKKLFCKWPKSSITASMIMHADDPNDNWPLYPITIVADSTFGMYYTISLYLHKI